MKVYVYLLNKQINDELKLFSMFEENPSSVKVNDNCLYIPLSQLLIM